MARVVELGLDAPIPAFNARGIKHYYALAFGSDFTPGVQPGEQGLSPALLRQLAGDEEGHLPTLRRLWWESWSLCSRELEDRARGGPQAQRHMTQIELEARRNGTLARLRPGFVVGRPTDVADSRITLFVSMIDSGTIIHPEWGAMAVRGLATVQNKPQEEWKKDAS